jgi:hypothetical protein
MSGFQEVENRESTFEEKVITSGLPTNRELATHSLCLGHVYCGVESEIPDDCSNRHLWRIGCRIGVSDSRHISQEQMGN